MGRWGNYPTDCDQAQDVIDLFMRGFDTGDDDKYYFECDEALVKEYLENLTIEQFNDNIQKNDCNPENLFALAFLYLEYKAIPKDKDVYESLRKSLEFHKCCLGFAKAISLVLLFQKHFDDVINQRLPLDPKVLKNIKK